MSTDGMTYEDKGIKPNKTNNKQILLKQLERVSTSSIMWYIVKRHKVGLLGTWAVIITVLYIFPPLPDILMSMFNK